MQLDRPPRDQGGAARFKVALAEEASEVQEAQRLRWQVFAEEQKATLSSPVAGLDIDRFDDHCEHLIVRDLGNGSVIGTYRLLTATAARRIGGYYSEQEFDLSRLADRRDGLLEVGRSCVHPNYRNGATIALLWSGLAGFLMQSGHRALIGCASIGLAGQEAAGAALARDLFRDHASPEDLRVMPRRPLPMWAFVDAQCIDKVIVPPLVKGYLRSGAVVCGEPCWDPEFQTADLFVYLSLDDVEARYARRFLQPQSALSIQQAA